MLLANYNLTCIVSFPSRTIYRSSTTINNFSIDISQNYTIKPLVNGMSDHDAQLLVMENVIMPTQELTTSYIRNFNDHSIHEFLLWMSMENWENIFAGNNLNVIFNKFLDTYQKYLILVLQKKNSTPRIHITLG
jgi:hypothetical protein